MLWVTSVSLSSASFTDIVPAGVHHLIAILRLQKLPVRGGGWCLVSKYSCFVVILGFPGKSSVYFLVYWFLTVFFLNRNFKLKCSLLTMLYYLVSTDFRRNQFKHIALFILVCVEPSWGLGQEDRKYLLRGVQTRGQRTGSGMLPSLWRTEDWLLKHRLDSCLEGGTDHSAG